MLVKSTTTPDIAPGPSEPSPPPYEAAWDNSLNHLQHRISAFHKAEQQGHEPTESETQKLAAAMHDVGDSHPDPKIRGEWHRRAKRFSRAGRERRRGILNEVGGVVGALLSIPFVVVGTALHIVGGVVHTAGAVIGGLGDSVVGISRDAR